MKCDFTRSSLCFTHSSPFLREAKPRAVLSSLFSRRLAPVSLARPARRRRAGQAYLESILVVLVLLLLLFGFLQTALLYGGRDVLHHAASRAARARAVGFNEWMAEKAGRVAAIPVSGRLLAADVGADPDDVADGGSAFELSRIPSYLGAENHARAQYVLDYEEWRRGSLRSSESGASFSGGTLSRSVRFDAPLRMPFSPLVFPWAPRDEEGVPRLSFEATAAVGNHAGLYLR